MTRLWMGKMSDGKPAVRILKNDADEPTTTPETDTGKFQFDSLHQKVGYIKDIIEFEPDFSTYPVAGGTPNNATTYNYPPGSSASTRTAIVACWNFNGRNFQKWFLFKEYFGYSDHYPLVEVRSFKKGTTDTFKGPFIDTVAANDWGGAASFAGFTSNWFSTYRPQIALQSFAIQFTMTTSSGTTTPNKCLVTLFDLPGDETAIPDYSATPLSGQEVVRISGNSQMARVALPGRVVTDTNPDHFILHENKIPAKILATGEIALDALGTVTINLPFAVTSTTYMDYLVRLRTQVSFYNPPFYNSLDTGQSMYFEYQVVGSTIVITNKSEFNLVIRYMVCTDDNSGFTSGGSKVLLKGNDGTRDYHQIKRPGSSDSAPVLNDIMLDTRLTYLPILAEGFLVYPDDFPTVTNNDRGERMATLTIPNPNGLMLFPKSGVIYTETPPAQNDTRAAWNAHIVFVNTSGWSGQTELGSTWAQVVDDTTVNIYSCGNNPKPWSPNPVQGNPNMMGSRYYIFGLPNSF